MTQGIRWPGLFKKGDGELFGESHGDSTARPAKKPKPARSTLERCGARTRTPMKCLACGAAARVNKPCPACGAAMPEGHCKAPPVVDPVTGLPRNGRCRRHGGTGIGPTSPEGRAKALEALRKVNEAARARAAERAAQAAGKGAA